MAATVFEKLVESSALKTCRRKFSRLLPVNLTDFDSPRPLARRIYPAVSLSTRTFVSRT